MKKLLLSLVLIGFACVSFAGEVRTREIINDLNAPSSEGSAWVGVGLCPLLQYPSSTKDVSIFRLGLLVGKNHTTSGLDIATLGAMSDGSVNGISLAGLFNYSSWDMNGLQFSSLMSRACGHANGLQFALVTMTGSLAGGQIGIFNYAEQGHGVQIGLINRSERLEGLQLGLINLNLDSSVPVFPVVNFAF